MIFQCDGGPGGRRTQQEQDESYSEEEEETSSTSVENSEGEDEEEEEEEDDESEEEDSNTDENEEEEEETVKKRPTRTSSGPATSSSSSAKSKVETQRGRLTRQKAREEMPTKRLLRSRKKSPAAGAGARVPQVFKCPNCKKEFNNKVSLSRHTGWCKQKKPSSPRKKKGEGDSLKKTPKKEQVTNQNIDNVSVREAPTPPSGSKPRGRPSKKTPVPSTSSSSKTPKSTPVQIIQQHYHEEVAQRGEAVTLPSSVEEDFMQQKSPESSPGLMDTSSEEDYEQKEFAANAHQLISHRNSGSIDVVNTDPPGQVEGPVTCPQCKMTYRTFLGYQNHIPTCAPISSDEEDEEEDDVDVMDNSSGVPHFQNHNGPNWIAHQTLSETVIAPPAAQPMEVQCSEEESSSDDGTGVDDEINTPANTFVQHEEASVVPPPSQSSPLKYHEISIVSNSVGKSPLKIILPPDNTPQVINASGLTLERLERPHTPKTVAAISQVRSAIGSPQKCATPPQVMQLSTPTPPPPQPVYHPISITSSSSSPSLPLSPYPNSQYPHQPSLPQSPAQHPLHPPPPPVIASPSPISSSRVAVSSPSTSSVSVPLIPPVHAGGNPPTYTQAQLMPGTVLHNSIMPVPQQQMSTSAGDTFHLHQPVSSQSLSQFPGAHFPVCYTTQATSNPQPTYRLQTSIPGVNSALSGFPPNSSYYIGGPSQSQQQQLQMAAAMAQAQSQMLRHPVTEQQRLQTPQMTQFPQQVPTIPGQMLGQLPTSQIGGGLSLPGQQHPLFANANGSIGPYGVPTNPQQSTLPMQIAGQFQQNGAQMSNNAMTFPQLLQQQQMSQHQTTLNPQQLPMQQQQPAPNGSLPNSTVDASQQQFHNLQSQLAQYQQQQQHQFFQNPPSNLPKLPENLMAQTPQVLQQQTVLNGQQQMTTHSVGNPGMAVQMQQLQQRSAAQLQQQQHLSQPIFQQTIPGSNPGQLQAAPGFVQAFQNLQQSTDNNSPISVPGAPSQQQQHQQVTMPHVEHPNSNLNLNTSQGQMELNLQQQVQLHQQQQQFLALQQQMQQNSDPNRSQQSQQQQQVTPHNMQAFMMNGSLHWAKPGQPLQQIPAQMPQQQQQQQQQTTPTAEAVTSPPNAPQTPQAPAFIQQPPPAQQQQQQQQQQALPQVIQHLTQVTDNAGNTYIIIAPQQPQQTIAQNTGTAGNTTGNNTAQLLSLLPGLQGLPCQQQQQQIQRVNSSSSVQCSANGVASHSPGTSSASTGNVFHPVGKSSPCPCATCKEKTGTANALEKYKKVLPYPSASDSQHPHLKTSPNIAPKPPISIRPAIPKQAKVVRVQTALTKPAGVQLTLARHTLSPGSSQVKLLPVQQQVGLVGVTSSGNAAPISSPNIAVVRPMENPLQRLSDQISQIESTFMSSPAVTPVPQPAPPPLPPTQVQVTHNQTLPSQGPYLTLLNAAPSSPSSTTTTPLPITISSGSPSQQVSHVITLEAPSAVADPETQNENVPQTETEDPVLNIPMPRLGLVDHGTPPARLPPSSTASPISSPQLSSPGSSIQSISAPSTPVGKGVKRKVLQVSPSNGEPEAKAIKLTLHRKENSHAYSIANIVDDSAKVNGSFKSLKIKATVSKSKGTAPQEGTRITVVVVPIIRLQPNPDPDTNDGNITIAEDENSSSSRDSEANALSSQGGGDNNNNNGSRGRLYTYRAVVVWEVRLESNNKVLFKSSDVRDVWDRVFQIVQGYRLNHNLPPVSYPATNIELPQSERAAKSMFNDFGLTHKAVEFLLRELPVLKRLSQQAAEQSSAKTPFPRPSPPAPSVADPISSQSTDFVPATSDEAQQHVRRTDSEESEELDEGNESGCARFERFRGRKAFDMFGWLTSKHRDPPTECDAPMESLKFLSAPLGMRYRKLKDKAREYLVIRTSEIHGRGLFTKRDIEKGEMLIEYAGEVIRPLVCDIREKYYESKAIGCYMFRINDHVIDATMRGNAARFINHSCEPNCEAKAVKIFGKHHIIIFSLRRISHGEELTYDYQFEKEEEKIICTCKSKYCRKYLN